MTLYIANILAAIAFALALGAEVWHAWRVRRLGRLAFGDGGPPPLWWLSIPARAAGVTALVWGAATLLSLEPRRLDAEAEPAEKDFRRLMVVLDVSPSMQLADAGAAHDQRRSRRGGDIMLDVLGRVALSKCKASVVAFYNGAKPVAVDVTDLAVLENIFRDLPLDQAFEPGPSELFKGLGTAFDLAKDWPMKSTTLVVISDGDVPPATGMPAVPPAISEVLVVGVGDEKRPTFIAGHQSRQDASALLQLATRLKGQYFNCNVAGLPPAALRQLIETLPQKDESKPGMRELALAAAVGGGTLVAIVPVALSFLAALWRRPVKMGRRARNRWYEVVSGPGLP